MTSTEIIDLIDSIDKSLPGRMSGNEVNSIIAKRIQSLAVTDRKSLIKALSKMISFREPCDDLLSETKLWMALSIGKDLSLYELKSDIQALLKDVRAGKFLDTIDIPTIEHYLESLNLLELSDRDELIKKLRKHLSFRPISTERTYKEVTEEGNIWMALDIAKKRFIYELKPDIECLLKDAKEGKVLELPSTTSVEKYLKSFSEI